MRFGILGELEIVDGLGERRDPAARRQRVLLQALLARRGEPASADELVEVLWGEGQLPQRPNATLRTYVTRLRTALEPEHVSGDAALLVGGPDSYRLDLTGHELDADTFERAAARAAELVEVDPALALEAVEAGLALWRGPAWQEVADELWVKPDVTRLRELHTTALELQYRCQMELGRYEVAIARLEAHVQQHQLRERPHALLMQALDRAGRAAEATKVFHRFRHRLQRETGMDPSRSLRELHLRLLSHSDAEVPAHAGPGDWNRLPRPRTRLIGRTAEVAALWERLSEHQFVTLTGAGGIGKTRLALELAHRTREAGGQVAVAGMVGATCHEDVVAAVFDAVRLPAAARRSGVDGLVRLFRSRRALLVVDNCEHVVDAVAALVDHLTRALPELTVLTTSRETLAVEGEQVHRVLPLDRHSATELFEQRALARGAVITTEPHERRAIDTLCQRLDGLPLALELAAAQATFMSAGEIVERLDERLWLLAGGSRRADRHTTLAAAIGWSHDLLDEAERSAFRAAATFVDGFDAPALAAVAGLDEREAVELLASLVRKSLLEIDAAPDGGRFRLLQPVRMFALDQLRLAGEMTERRDAHAEYWLDRACRTPPRLTDLPASVNGSMCRMRLRSAALDERVDLAEHLAAMDWFDHLGRLGALGRLAGRLHTVLEYDTFVDVERRWLGRLDVVGALTHDPAEQSLYLVASALNACHQGAMDETHAFGDAALAGAQDPTTYAIAAALAAQGCPDQARTDALIEEGLESVSEQARATRRLLNGLRGLALIARGELEQAVTALAPHAYAGDAFAAAEQLLALVMLGRHEEVRAMPLPGVDRSEAATLWAYRWPLTRAMAAAAEGDHRAAAHELLDAAEQVTVSPMHHDNDILLACAALAHQRGDDARGLLLLGAVGSQLISPGATGLTRHLRRRTRSGLAADEQAAILELAGDLDTRRLLADELERLTAAAVA